MSNRLIRGSEWAPGSPSVERHMDYLGYLRTKPVPKTTKLVKGEAEMLVNKGDEGPYLKDGWVPAKGETVEKAAAKEETPDLLTRLASFKANIAKHTRQEIEDAIIEANGEPVAGNKAELVAQLAALLGAEE